MRPLFGPGDGRQVITLRELAELVHRPVKTIYEYAKKGDISAYRNGKGKGCKWLIHRRDAEIWYENMHQV